MFTVQVEKVQEKPVKQPVLEENFSASTLVWAHALVVDSIPSRG